MKLYWGSHTCAIGIHLLLEEVSAIYETEKIDVAGGATRQPSIADAALFYVERWAPQQGITLPVNVQRHHERMLARPTVNKVRQLWGEK